MKPLLTLQEVFVCYPKELFEKKYSIVRNFSLTVYPKQIIAIVGDNGTGKTTLLKAIAGLIHVSSGKIEKTSSLSYIPEQCNPMPFLTTNDFLWYNAEIAKIPKKEIQQKINFYLENAALLDKKNNKIVTFSKGMRQRLCIAQALLCQSKLILLDEPFSGLDQNSKNFVQKMCFSNTQQQAIIYTCHDKPFDRSHVTISLT